MATGYNGIPMVYPNAMRMALLLAATMAVIKVYACSSASHNLILIPPPEAIMNPIED
tara:strand:- start:122 stop:292 length:171 start_codon:yes stop_codon:yes gene_type:complete